MLLLSSVPASPFGAHRSTSVWAGPVQALSPEASLRPCLWTRFVSDPWLHGPCTSLFCFPLLFCSACGKATGCAGSEAWLMGRGGSRWAGTHRARPSGPAPLLPVPTPPPPGPRPVPPTLPWPQSLHCGPMNGVAFCLVGIPPRPEPRPPQVRAQDMGQAGAGPGATSGLGSLRRPPSLGTAAGAWCPAGERQEGQLR